MRALIIFVIVSACGRAVTRPTLPTVRVVNMGNWECQLNDNDEIIECAATTDPEDY